MRPMALAWCVCAAATLAGCERAMHDMYDQPKKNPGTPSAFFADHNASRQAPYGSIVSSLGPLAGTTSGRRGIPLAMDVPVNEQQSNPNPMSMALLQRGRQRYEIFCSACHGLSGQGNGMVVARGFPAPRSFTSPRLLAEPDGHFEEAIRRGYGVMYPFADRVDESDRWAIVAYIRALQLSQHADAGQLGLIDRQALSATNGPETQ